MGAAPPAAALFIANQLHGMAEELPRCRPAHRTVWCIPGGSILLAGLKTAPNPDFGITCTELYDQLEDALTEFGERVLGCRGISPMWLSYYVHGHRQVRAWWWVGGNLGRVGERVGEFVLLSIRAWRWVGWVVTLLHADSLAEMPQGGSEANLQSHKQGKRACFHSPVSRVASMARRQPWQSVLSMAINPIVQPSPVLAHHTASNPRAPQELHADNPHGPWAFVLSLTHWEGRPFTGGETVILQPNVLDYWRGFDPALGTETPQLVGSVGWLRLCGRGCGVWVWVWVARWGQGCVEGDEVGGWAGGAGGSSLLPTPPLG